MGETPDEIRAEIEDTRDRMGETVEAIGYRADVPGRAKEKVTGVKDRATNALSGAKERIVGSTRDTTSSASAAAPSRDEVAAKARHATSVAQENPLGLAIGSVAVGFLAGLLVPTSKIEDEKIGPIADQIKDAAKTTGHEVVERGKQVAQETAGSAKEAAQEALDRTRSAAQDQLQQQAKEMKSSVQEKAEGVSSELT